MMKENNSMLVHFQKLCKTLNWNPWIVFCTDELNSLDRLFSKNQPENILLPWIIKYECIDLCVSFCLALRIYQHDALCLTSGCGMTAARRLLERAWDGEHGGTNQRQLGRPGGRGWWARRDQPQTAGACRTVVSNRLGKAAARADMGGAGDGEHGGINHRPPGRAGLKSLIGAGQILVGYGLWGNGSEGLGDAFEWLRI